MKVDTEQKILEKAKSKKDGCYRYGGVAYRVRDGKVTHFAESGTILERAFGFNVVFGSYPFGINSDETGQKLLKTIE